MDLSKMTLVEIGENVAGPLSGQVLADLGMTVIKVENPSGGDASRHMGAPKRHGSAAMFHANNRNKRSLALDLKDPANVALLKRFIVERADVVLQNLRPGTVEKIGLDAASLRAVKPSLVYCNVGAFTKGGPNAHKGGYDLILQAYSGLLSLTGYPDRPPVRIGISSIDITASLWNAIGILAALAKRSVTGEGATVDNSLFETSMFMMGASLAQYKFSGKIPVRAGAQLPGFVPLQPFDTKDGQLVIATANDGLFRRVADALGKPEWKTDPRFATLNARFENKDLVVGAIQEVLSSNTRAHWQSVLDAFDVPCGPVHDLAQATSNPEVEYSQIFKKLPGRDDIEVVGFPLSFNGDRPPIRHNPPDLGEFNAEFFATLGSRPKA
ncbi:MAG: CoA transferase [Alphaproteobacteria bacterium]